jgi:outer membrane biosynthesis protein TonB
MGALPDAGREAKPKNLSKDFSDLTYTASVKSSFNGPVKVAVLINERGQVEKVDVLEPGAVPEFVEWVRQVMAEWEFEPAYMEGKPVVYELILTLEIKPL